MSARAVRSAPVPVVIPASVVDLQPWVAAGVLDAGDVHLADWLARSTGTTDPLVTLAVALASWAARHGHACLHLDIVRQVVEQELALDADDSGIAARRTQLDWPNPAAWRNSLAAATEAVRVVEPGDHIPVLDALPLVLCGNSVYLQRYWVDECTVITRLLARLGDTGASLAAPAAELLDRLLPQVDTTGQVNQQRAAAELVVRKHLSIVVGGPGTGKTYSVARILAALVADGMASGRMPRIALAAPTGKAKARLGETIQRALQPQPGEPALDPEVAEVLGSLRPTTIHGLLGSQGVHRQRFARNEQNPLQHDVVVIDETSMVSLPLLARLLEAVRPDARLVLIGDPDQLESVELGAVLGDLVAASRAADSPLSGNVVRLLRVHRFDSDSPIALLADAVRDGDAVGAVQRLASGAAGDLLAADGSARSSVRFVAAHDPRSSTALAAVGSVLQPLLAEVRQAAEQGDAERALTLSTQARVLCAHREGPWGVSEWNRRGEQWIGAPGTVWYAGRPVLVTRNDARTGLSNGDTGVVVVRDARPMVVFAGPAGVRELDPAQLDSVDTAFAMTVHKSQGSEYPHVVLVLPPASSPLVGRELLYTAVTRASRHLLVVGSEESVRACVGTPARRMTGLAAALTTA